MQPYSTVESKGFRFMMHTSEPKQVIPWRQYFTEKVLPQPY